MALKIVLVIVQLGFAVWLKWARSDDEKKKKVKELKEEADDAIKSKDIARVHALVERINRL